MIQQAPLSPLLSLLGLFSTNQTTFGKSKEKVTWGMFTTEISVPIQETISHFEFLSSQQNLRKGPHKHFSFIQVQHHLDLIRVPQKR